MTKELARGMQVYGNQFAKILLDARWRDVFPSEHQNGFSLSGRCKTMRTYYGLEWFKTVNWPDWDGGEGAKE